MYRKLLSKYVSFNKTVLAMILQIAEGSVFHDHVGFPLRPFTDLLCMHYYHPTPLNLHWTASNQCPEIIVVKNGELNLDWVATSIIQLNHFKRPSPINKRPVIMSNQCPQRTVVINNGKLNLDWAATAIKQSLPPICLFNESCPVVLTSIKHLTRFDWLYFKNTIKENSPR